MMKKSIIPILLGTMIMGGAYTAQAMDAGTLLSHPEKYKVVAADKDKVVFADVEDLHFAQTKDYPASQEWANVKLYVERFRTQEQMNPFDWMNHQLASGIDEYEGVIFHHIGDGVVWQKKELVKRYTALGTEYKGPLFQKDIELDPTAIYMNLKNRLPKQVSAEEAANFQPGMVSQEPVRF